MGEESAGKDLFRDGAGNDFSRDGAVEADSPKKTEPVVVTVRKKKLAKISIMHKHVT